MIITSIVSFAAGAVVGTYLHSKIVSVASVLQKDFVTIEARVKGLEQSVVTRVLAEINKIEGKSTVATPAVVPPATPAPAPVATPPAAS